jgi:hypothetical protein
VIGLRFLDDLGAAPPVENARRVNRPDLARHHEQLARAIERIARRQAEHNADRVPPLR